MTAYFPINPACSSDNGIVFIGNVGILDFVETDTRFSIPATAELVIDVIADPAYATKLFANIHLTLEIVGPAGALFVDHGGRNNFHWDVPTVPGSWIENVIPTPMLRIRLEEGVLHSGKLCDGLSHHVGVAGLDAGAQLRFTAVAVATEASLVTSTCAMGVEIDAGGFISCYLK